ncbi:hypothetical protein ATCC90586_011137 [Pythium insidiosum]|nr:hypothetical protein ATCC90586_011137 [Pythium insidiosum]
MEPASFSREDALDQEEEIEKVASIVRAAERPSEARDSEFAAELQRSLDRHRSQNAEHHQRLSQERDARRADEQRELQTRRNENAMMYLEDVRTIALERRWRHQAVRRAIEERRARWLAQPIFSCVQELGGGESFAQFSQRKQRVGDESRKASDRFHVSVYSHRAKGYTQDGLRLVAMDPASQSTFAMTMSSREYNALGYGRTREGLAAFCRWLCLVYERRARQFRLVWSGAPCPPPLRVRDYDQALCGSAWAGPAAVGSAVD